MAAEAFACPAPECSHQEEISEEDPDACFGEILGHIRASHPDIPQDPATLWPRISIVPAR
jgi:hypothetical protein